MLPILGCFFYLSIVLGNRETDPLLPKDDSTDQIAFSKESHNSL